MSRNPIFKALCLDSDTNNDIATLTILANMAAGEGSSSRHSPRKRRTFIDRDSVQGHNQLFRDYFAESPVYGPNLFRRRFRMSRPLFLRIHDKVQEHDPFFVQTSNCAGRLGLSSLQKMTAALRMLAYGVPADCVDEYVRMGESTAIECLKNFVRAVIEVFGNEYLRTPNREDLDRLLQIGKVRGFPGMLGSIDCMHWKWKNCPTAWQGMFTGHCHEPTIILEAVASYDLWIWHSFFGLPGSHNDINVLDRSTIFHKLAQGRDLPVNYSINGSEYTMGYYLADGIYPKWSTFVKTIPQPQGNKNKHFAAAQESARKDVERAFGVLQARFAIVRGPARFWKREVLGDIMTACVILHNMIVENERNDDLFNMDFENVERAAAVEVTRERTSQFDEFIERHTTQFDRFIERHHRIRETTMHYQLQSDLVEHLWDLHSKA